MKLEPGDTVDTGLNAAVHTSEQVEQAELIDRRQEGFSSVRVNISKKEVGYLDTCMRHNHNIRDANDPSVFTITEKASISAFCLRHY